ncbi:MAG: hypothetical protein U9P79_01740 [Candidatus Cloacimonadota bacterium]|nr:hypothetical protein [Candidatus Cloacimonadota bacterium]
MIMKLFEKLLAIDRRIIFILIFLSVAIPLLFVIGFKIEVTPEVENVYELVDSAPKGSHVLISFDYGPSTKPEIQPMAEALIRHCFRNDYKVICTALWPMGVQMCMEAIDEVSPDFPNKKYGIDFVNLGYKAGGLVTINLMGRDFCSAFPTDAANTPIDELQIMDGIKNFKRLKFIIGLSAGAPGLKEWVQVGHDAYGIPLAGGSTAVQVPSLSPYVNAQKQLTGLLGGLKGAAEYEVLINHPGSATKGMDAQSIAHLVIIIFIIIGNIGYFVSKKNEKKIS